MIFLLKALFLYGHGEGVVLRACYVLSVSSTQYKATETVNTKRLGEDTEQKFLEATQLRFTISLLSSRARILKERQVVRNVGLPWIDWSGTQVRH